MIDSFAIDVKPKNVIFYKLTSCFRATKKPNEGTTNNRTYLIRFSLYLNNHYPSNGLFNSKSAYQTRKALSTDFTKRIFLITKFVNRK
jgi:hypothetical protein